MSSMVDQALKRPTDFNKRAPSEQWAIDKRLGILDWDPTPEEEAEFKRRYEARKAEEEDPARDEGESRQEEATEVKQVIVWRKDLKVRKGKFAAQVAHASMKVFFDRMTSKAARSFEFGADSGGWDWHGAIRPWIEGSFTKIVVGVEDEADLLALEQRAREHKLPTALVVDKGLTEFKGVPTTTCLAIGPAKAEALDEVTGFLKLL
jgi:PTH2 family peptidyl-tRNA hydrolase